VRFPATIDAIQRFLPGLAARVRGPGRIYLVGAPTAVLYSTLRFPAKDSGTLTAKVETWNP
jgi:hypothetical protein